MAFLDQNRADIELAGKLAGFRKFLAGIGNFYLVTLKESRRRSTRFKSRNIPKSKLFDFWFEPKT